MNPLALLRAHPTWYVFPIKKLGKQPPLIADNLANASRNIKQIESWSKSYPGANWGLSLAKSRTIVMDVDRKPGKVGQDTLDMLTIMHGELPPTLTVRTPSGGLHFYFTEANGVHHQMRTSAFGRDIDSTNYVLLPGCVIDDDGGRQIAGQYDLINDAPVAPAPTWFADYLRLSNTPDDVSQDSAIELDQPGNVAHAIDYLRRDAPPAIQGQGGEHTLLMVAGQLKDMGISRECSVDLLLEHYNPRCEPPWDIGDGPTADRLDIKVANAWRYLKQTQPGANTAEADFGPTNDEDLDFIPPQISVEDRQRARILDKRRRRGAARRRRALQWS